MHGFFVFFFKLMFKKFFNGWLVVGFEVQLSHERPGIIGVF